MAEHARQNLTEEAELVERARRRDAAAIRMLVKRHNQRLYRLARSILRNDSDAEDALQEAYVHAFANLNTFRGESRFGTWLARIVLNEAIGFVRRRKPTVDISVVAEISTENAQIIPFPAAEVRDNPETLMARNQIRTLLEGAIDKLPEGFRTVFVARVVEGMSVEETAELLGILPQTVKTRLHRARALLRNEIERRVGPALNDAFPFAGSRCERFTERVLARLDLS